MDNTVTKEETNYLRIANLLLRIAPPAVRVKFDSEFDPVMLQKTLNQSRLQKLEKLRQKGIINSKQWDLLFPRTADTTLGADLSRIKYYRNKIAHCDDGILDDLTFHACWDDICQALIRIGGPMYEQICADVKMSKLDQNYKEMLIELRNLNTETIPKVVLGIHGSKIQEWEKNTENIVETKAIMSLKDLIYTNGIVSITGPPGCGKSTASQCVALYLQNHHGYHIVPANYPAEILQYRNPEQKQVFVYDDVCGKYEIEIHSVNDWIKLSPDILKVLTPNSVKVLAICRSNISRNKQFERIKIFSKNQCDLHSHENSLTTNERILIAEKFLGKEDVNILKGHKLLDKYDMFPLLCRFYSRKPIGSLKEFFSRPVDVIKEDLESLMAADDQTPYATLALFVLCNNCIKTDMLCSSSIIKQILEELADRCTLRHVFSIQVVKSQLYMLTDSYVEKSNDTYKIMHDKIFDILVSFYGEHMFDLVLLHSGSDFLRDRFQFQSIGANQEDCPIIVPTDKEKDYFECLFTDVRDKKWPMIVFKNKQLKYEIYRSKFVNYFATLPDDKKSQCNENSVVLFLWVLGAVVSERLYLNK